MFEVTADPDLRMLRLTMRGFWDDSTMAAYLKAMRKAMGDLLRGGGCRYLLIDMTDYPIQSKQIAESHGEQLRATKQVEGMRVALVMQSALSKLQAKRVAADTGHRTFESEEAALAWLLADRA